MKKEFNEEEEANIQVAIKVRPLIDKEKRNNDLETLKVDNNLIVN
jgi:hypothetical protein